MKANFLKLLFLTLLICLGCALVSCSIITPTSKESEYEKFSKTFALTLNENGDGYVVHGFSSSWDSSQADITIPDYIDGIPVTEIANSAFNNQNSFNTFYLPDTLKVLGEFAIPEEAGNIIIKGGVKYLGSKTNPYVVAVQSASEDQPTMTFVEGCKFINSYFKFRNSTITDITFPSSLLQINSWAFNHCKIRELNFNEGLITIGDYAFSGCSNLTKINLPNSLEKIGSDAFDCSITELFIPKNVQELGERAFQSSALAEITVDSENNYFSSNGGVLYTKDGTNLILCPKSLPVQEFIIPTGVEKISSYAFYDNRYIENLTIANTVKALGYSSLDYMQSLKRLTIYDSITNIGSLSVSTLSNLEFNEKDNGLYLGNDDNPYLLLSKYVENGNSDFSIPSSCKYVGKESFMGATLTKLFVHNGVISFGDDAFLESSIEKVVYEGSALDWCNIDFYDSIHYLSHLEMADYGSYSNPLSIGADLYIGNELLTEIVFPEGTTEIKGGIFYGYSRLTKVVIPDGVTEIGNLAFAYCDNLKNLELPNSVTHIGKWAFISCYLVTDFSLPEELITIDERAFANCHGLTKIIIPDKVTSIGEKAFYNCSNMLEVTLGKSVEEIDSSAFRYCSKMINAISKSPYIVLSKDVYHNSYLNEMAKFLYNANDTVTTNYEIDENGFVTMIYGEELCLMTYLGSNTEVVIPDGITTIYSNAFIRNYDLTSVIIPDSVTDIQSSAFSECRNLKSVILGNNVKSIGNSAFARNYNLEEIVLNEGLETIGRAAFYYTSLTHIEIPDSIVSIGDSAFAVTPLETVKLGSGLKTIEQATFNYCIYLKEIDLSHITTIGDWAFDSCKGLETVVFGDNLESIGRYAFRSCTSLKALSLTKNIKTLGEYAFTECSGLESVTLGINITDLGSYTFYNCKNLSRLSYNGSSTDWKALYAYKNNVFSGTKIYSVVCSNETIEVKR